MKNKPIIVICGDPESTFNEILIKTLKNKFFNKVKLPIIIIGSKKLFQSELKKLKKKSRFKILIVKLNYKKKNYILLIFL